MIRTGKCVTEDMFCKQKSRELKTAEAAASTALDEYKEGRRKMDVLNQKLPKSGNFLEIVEKHGDDIKKWEKLKTKTLCYAKFVRISYGFYPIYRAK